MKKFLLALVLGVGMLVPLAIPAAAEARPPRPYQARYHHYGRNHAYGYWHNGYYHYRR